MNNPDLMFIGQLVKSIEKKQKGKGRKTFCR